MSEPALVHETAIVEPCALVGAETRVWHHAHIRSGAVIGDGCTIGKNVYIDAGVTIGDGVKVQNNVSVYAGVSLGDEVFVGPSAVFTNDRFPAGRQRGLGDRPDLGIERGATIGANATIVCGNDVGRWATVGAGAVVTRNVQDHKPWSGIRPQPSRMGVPVRARCVGDTKPPDDLVCAVCRAGGTAP